jgi:hypothetical protein
MVPVIASQQKTRASAFLYSKQRQLILSRAEFMLDVR